MLYYKDFPLWCFGCCAIYALVCTNYINKPHYAQMV